MNSMVDNHEMKESTDFVGARRPENEIAILPCMFSCDEAAKRSYFTRLVSELFHLSCVGTVSHT